MVTRILAQLRRFRGGGFAARVHAQTTDGRPRTDRYLRRVVSAMDAMTRRPSDPKREGNRSVPRRHLPVPTAVSETATPPPARTSGFEAHTRGHHHRGVRARGEPQADIRGRETWRGRAGVVAVDPSGVADVAHSAAIRGETYPSAAGP